MFSIIYLHSYHYSWPSCSRDCCWFWCWCICLHVREEACTNANLKDHATMNTVIFNSSPSLFLRGDDGLQPPELDRGDPDLHQRHPRCDRLPEVHLRRSPWNLRKALNKDFTILLLRAGSQCCQCVVRCCSRISAWSEDPLGFFARGKITRNIISLLWNGDRGDKILPRHQHPCVC